MGKTFTFRSIARPSWRYRLYQTDADNPAHDWRRLRESLCSHISQYDTMGDGEVQHCADCLVSTSDTYDVVVSLASSLHLMPFDLKDREQCVAENVLSWFWRSEPSASDKEIRFALDLKHNEKKDTYYTFKDDGCKKSFSESKRHDRRWMKLRRPSEGEGVVSTVMSILFCEESGLKPYGLIQHIATIIRVCQMVDEEIADHLAQKELRGKGSVFESKESSDMLHFFNCMKRITSFRKSIHDLRWVMKASEGHADRVRDGLVSV